MLTWHVPVVTRLNQAVVIDVLVNDSDPYGELMVVGFDGLPEDSTGTYQVDNTGWVTFLPSGWLGDTFTVTYSIEDGFGGANSAQLIIIDPRCNNAFHLY